MQHQIETSYSTRTPTMLIREMGGDTFAVRLWNIGGRQLFMMMLQRFRGEFLLARPQKIDGLDWLVLRTEQRQDINDWCRRYGLKVVEET